MCVSDSSDSSCEHISSLLLTKPVVLFLWSRKTKACHFDFVLWSDLGNRFTIHVTLTRVVIATLVLCSLDMSFGHTAGIRIERNG